MPFSEPIPIPGIDYPPGFKPHPKPISPVRSVVRTTTAAAVGSSSVSAPPPFPPQKPPQQPISQVGVVAKFHMAMTGEPSGYGDRVPRKRSKPEILDPSPTSTEKRRRGRPPGSGRKHKMASGLSSTEKLQEVAVTPNSSQFVQKREETRPMNAFVGNGDGHPARAGPTTQLGSFVVNPSLVPTFQAILNKHGDIAENCPLQYGPMRTSVLEAICKIVLELERKNLTEINNSCLYNYFSVLEHAKRMNFDVRWLSQKLGKIHEAVKSIEEANNLADNRTIRMKRISCMQKDLQVRKVELEKLNARIQEEECQLILETMEAEKVKKCIMDIESRVQLFQRNSLVDGLL